MPHSRLQDSAAQPTNYAGFDLELLALVLAKEKRNEVFFLKPDDYAFEGYGSDAAGEPGSWRRASDWLQTVLDPAATTTTTGGGGTYRPLLLDPAAWRAMSPGQLVHCFSITGVIDNLKSGGHDCRCDGSHGPPLPRFRPTSAPPATVVRSASTRVCSEAVAITHLNPLSPRSP